MYWYVVQAKDLDNAQLNLKAQKYEIYVPFIEVVGKKGVRMKSMFGNYFFVFFDVEKNGWQNIAYTRGVRRLMCMHGEETPSKLPRGFVDGLKEREKQGEFKLREEIPITVGEVVRIMDGPLAGTEGICSFSTQKRVGVLLHLLNRETRVYLSKASVIRT